MSRIITLYDISSKLSPQAWSPNVWKARYVLNYKRIPYTTVYVSYPDIKELWSKLALSPLAAVPSATLPIISVPSGDGGPPTLIADSQNIALYLDHEYPESPAVFPPNTAALQSAFCHVLPSILAASARPLLLPTTLTRLDNKGSEYFGRTRKVWFGFDAEKSKKDRDTNLANLQKAFTSLHEILNTNRADGETHPLWVMGSLGPTFADFALGGWLTWIKLMGDDELWASVSSWNGGRWAKHLQELEPYQQVPE